MCSHFAASAQAQGVAPEQLAILQDSVRAVNGALAVRLASTNHPTPLPRPLRPLQPSSLRCACKRAPLLSYVQQRVSVAGHQDSHWIAARDHRPAEARPRGREGAVHAFRAARPPSRRPLPPQIRPTNFGWFVERRRLRR